MLTSIKDLRTGERFQDGANIAIVLDIIEIGYGSKVTLVYRHEDFETVHNLTMNGFTAVEVVA